MSIWLTCISWKFYCNGPSWNAYKTLRVMSLQNQCQLFYYDFTMHMYVTSFRTLRRRFKGPFSKCFSNTIKSLELVCIHLFFWSNWKRLNYSEEQFYWYGTLREWKVESCWKYSLVSLDVDQTPLRCKMLALLITTYKKFNSFQCCIHLIRYNH